MLVAVTRIHRPTSGGIQSNRYLGNQTRPAGHGSMNANRYTQVGLGVGEGEGEGGVVTLTLLPNSYVGMYGNFLTDKYTQYLHESLNLLDNQNSHVCKATFF